MKNKIITFNDVIKLLRDDMSIMVGGFATVGTPGLLLDAIIESKIKNITIICNDSGLPGHGVSRIIATRQVKKLIASHIGRNPQTGELMNTGEMEVELVPQGTLAERIRAGGAGLGGVLTPTGLGTDVAMGKQIVSANGKEYLLELPLRADMAFIRGSIVDKFGNVFYRGSTRNFNPAMAMAADTVVVAAQQVVETGEIEPENIVTPGILVDYILEGEQYE